jgi:uncharacterized protein
MSRPFKCRRIGYLPEVTIFKPAGVPLRELEVINLSYEEVEAIRLKDLEGLEQKPAAEKMNVSRPTFQRILFSARKKLAAALLGGKAIRIEGGNYEVSLRSDLPEVEAQSSGADVSTSVSPAFNREIIAVTKSKEQ